MNTETAKGRAVVAQLDHEFAAVVEQLRVLTSSVPASHLYADQPATTLGEHILRSAGAVEQLFGGLTANLWDDPFEWTLPETLSTPQLLLDYLSEVDSIRKRAFSSIHDDDDLLKYVSAPSGESRTLLSLLLETLVRASCYCDRAKVATKILSAAGVNGFII
jgi:hypothetical protein